MNRWTKARRGLLIVAFVLFLVLVWMILTTPFSTFRYIKRDLAERANGHPTLDRAAYLRILGSPDGTVEGLGKAYDLSNPIDVVWRTAYPTADGERAEYTVLRQVYLKDGGIRLQSHRMFLKNWKEQLAGEWEEAFVADQVVIIKDVIRFGSLKVGIGSPRWKVKLAYLGDIGLDAYNTRKTLLEEYPLPLEDRPEDFTLGYRNGDMRIGDGGMEIAFRFDERNRVDCIVLTVP